MSKNVGCFYLLIEVQVISLVLFALVVVGVAAVVLVVVLGVVGVAAVVVVVEVVVFFSCNFRFFTGSSGGSQSG